MAILQNNINYNGTVKEIITNSGGTIVFVKDNMIIASEISESLYRDLLKNAQVEKIDIVPLKTYDYKPLPISTNTVINTITNVSNS
jgi:hypothetical protein